MKNNVTHGYDDDIIQIAAKDMTTGDVFSNYVMPTAKVIPRRITNLTGIEMHGHIMYSNLQPVPSYQLNDALLSFDTWLKQHGNTILVAHNAPFDARMLINASLRTGLSVCSTVLGFIDTLPIFRRAYPGRNNYKQQSLVRDLIGTEYVAHNADADVEALAVLCKCIHAELLNWHDKVTSVRSVTYKIHKARNESVHFSSFTNVVSNQLMTKTDAKIVAGSGLAFTNLETIFQRSGHDGLYQIFKKIGIKKPLVLAKKIQAIC